MPAIAYVDDRYVRRADAVVHIEDRGNQFADAVYEACEVHHGAIVDLRRHLDRLDRSLAELRIAPPMGRAAMTIVLREVARRNKAVNGFIYLQVSRGAAPRSHTFEAGMKPTFFVTYAASGPSEADPKYETGVAVITLPDLRWARVDIKTVGLLANVLAKQAARERGAYECLMYDDMGLVTEGASTNAWIVDEHGRLRTRDIQANILRGVTRAAVLELAAAEGVELEERAFSVDEAKRAREVFVTAASAFVMPLVSLDGLTIGDGQPGPVATRLRELYLEQARRGAI